MNMKIHPLTHIVLAAELAFLTVIPDLFQGLAVLILWFMFIFIIPKRTETKVTFVFIKVLAVAALFLFLIHGIHWSPPEISVDGIYAGLVNFTHIAAPVVGIIYLSRMIHSEEMFALLIGLRVPPVIILIIFRTLWLVPRFIERINEVITAQKLRGMKIESISERIRALIPTINPIFSSMLEEISENSLTITARGLLQPGRKSHYTILKFDSVNRIITIAITIIFFVLLVIFK